MGFEKYEHGNYYLGQFAAGKAHGKGEHTWIRSGEVYDGQWEKG